MRIKVDRKVKMEGSRGNTPPPAGTMHLSNQASRVGKSLVKVRAECYS